MKLRIVKHMENKRIVYALEELKFFFFWSEIMNCRTKNIADYYLDRTITDYNNRYKKSIEKEIAL